MPKTTPSPPTQNSPHPPPTVLIIGAGAVGCLFGGKLSQAGARVSTVSKSDYEAAKTNGIHVASHWGDFHFRPEKVCREPSEYCAAPSLAAPDYVIITTKVLPEVDSAALIRPVVGPQTAIALIQNGIGNEPPLAAAYPQNEIISGLAFVCVSRVAPGKIEHLDYGRLALGSYPSGISEKTKRLGDLFASVGVPCTVTDDIVKARWRKLVWNAAFNGMAVLSGGATTRDIMDNPETAALARKIMEDVVRLSAFAGHALAESDIQKNLDDTAAMTPYKPSMLLDYEAGRPMEVEAIHGNAVRIARHLGVKVPYLETFYALLNLMNKNNLRRESQEAIRQHAKK